MPIRLLPLLVFLLVFPIFSNSIEIRCYAGLKYVVGQEVLQDTENCDAILGMGESYCYKFMEETSLNEVVKMGCSSFFCNGIRNRCMETDLLGMRGTLCCCNDRHYCNSKSIVKMATFHILLLILLSYGFSILATEACAIPTADLSPAKLADVPVSGADVALPKKNPTATETTPPVGNDVEQSGDKSEENSNSRYQPITIFSAILTVILCKMV
ncbi:hypothetical protein GCK72_013760 [Caenorhabditis remanei]|uniref:Uncharacterized protein n=1 Tax=Caenorhabditis remanei TaxID=31234 RepID=A0A6A5GRZ4_CAERE|nr:hypothetical protein GCK72_013760 [Caenorhabditis remanei]KAF1757305.1 hypothetical protein GCK72_013760 [Caenorhabditis remanei]